MFEFEVQSTDGPARAGRWRLPHGIVETPCFMPVGTQGTVRALSPRDLDAVGASMVLANTYHLHVRPGEDVVAKLGGLHRFMGWSGPLLTDSGGFQVFSLAGARKVSEEGVEFQSHVDGMRRRLTPERAVEIQWTLGADVAMAFDHVVPGQTGHAAAEDAAARTLRWLARSRDRFRELSRQEPERQTLVPIVQGGVFSDLRRASLAGTLETGADAGGPPWRALAVGGLSVGEPKPEMAAVLADLATVLPPALPRYLMGVGFPEDFIASVGRGMDLADCVAPTRMGRNGAAFSDDGPINI
ncbi:MAG TPA: tRNA guanosine(34) transglycosylase Tgt, partial [Gemmatimonadales bacterium]|nr:tRNA guanosine(34) transglycosylase Tgt [Gemmatimonadales bacterium]